MVLEYYVRAYATNENGTSFGNPLSFTSGNCYSLPVVQTLEVIEVTSTSAIGGGNIIDNGGSHIQAKGVCWSTNPDPTVSDSKTIDGSGMENFTSSLTGLDPYSKYYICAYATNSVGTGYGEEVSIRTLWDNSNIVDYDGNTYQSLQIGEQVWMKENLKVTHYSDGSLIPLVEDSAALASMELSDRAYCWYDNHTANRDIYGGLYTWAAAMNGAVSSDANPSGGGMPGRVAPAGDTEWKQLEIYLGMSQVVQIKQEIGLG